MISFSGFLHEQIQRVCMTSAGSHVAESRIPVRLNMQILSKHGRHAWFPVWCDKFQGTMTGVDTATGNQAIAQSTRHCLALLTRPVVALGIAPPTATRGAHFRSFPPHAARLLRHFLCMVPALHSSSHTILRLDAVRADPDAQSYTRADCLSAKRV